MKITYKPGRPRKALGSPLNALSVKERWSGPKEGLSGREQASGKGFRGVPGTTVTQVGGTDPVLGLKNYRVSLGPRGPGVVAGVFVGAKNRAQALSIGLGILKRCEETSWYRAVSGGNPQRIRWGRPPWEAWD